MAEISISIRNQTSSDYNVHVYDLFGSGRKEVGGSPYALAVGEQSGFFLIHAKEDGRGTMAYDCDGGPSLTNIDCNDGDIVPVD